LGVLERERDLEGSLYFLDSFPLRDRYRESLRLLLLLLLRRGGGGCPGEGDLEYGGLRLLLCLSRLEGSGGLRLRLLLGAPLPGLCRLANLRGGDLERLRDLDEGGVRDAARRRRRGGLRSLRSLYLRSFPRGGGGSVREGDRARRLRGAGERLRLGVDGGEREDLDDSRRNGVGFREFGETLGLGVRGGEREVLGDGRRGGVGLRAIGDVLRLGNGGGEREDRVLAFGEGERLRKGGGDLYRRGGGERDPRAMERERRRGDGERRRF